MSMLTEVYILERYGVRLGVEQLAEVLGTKKSTLYNLISQGQCPVPTYVDGGKRYADYRDVARHFDECRARARNEAEQV